SGSHSLILVHNVKTSKDDLEQISKNKSSLPLLYWCVCPNANLYINGRLPGEHLFQQQSSQIVVGTDSLASNRTLSVLEELKMLQQHYPELMLTERLKGASIKGTRARRIDVVYGSVE